MDRTQAERRNFLKAAGGGLAASALAARARASRPNIVFLLTDDQRYDELGCTGHPVMRTPNIDALAREGVRFDRFFATTATCLPARTNLVTGQWERCHTIGWPGERALSTRQWADTFPMVLKRAGYFTGLIGKCNIRGVRQSQLDYYCGSDDTALGFYPKEYGTGRVLFRGARAEAQVEVIGEAAEDFLGTEHGFYERSLPGMRRFLGRRPPDRPFLLYLAFEVPHAIGTLTMQQRPTDDALYRTAYRDQIERMPLVPGYVAQRDVKTRKLPKEIYSGVQSDPYSYRFTPERLREHQVRICQTISGVDRLVGRIRKRLAELGLAENTIIIFTSDQGIMHGEWGYGGKALLYEPSIHVPLIIHDPRPGAPRGRRVREELTVTADVAPTILDLCGLTPPDRMQGRSLVPLMRHQKVPWREDFFCECQMLGQDYPIVHGVRGKRWKYMRYWPIRPCPPDYREILNLGLGGEPPAYEELYDLQTDPAEQHNLATDARHRGELASLRRRCTALGRESLGRDPDAPLPSETTQAWKDEMKDFYDVLQTKP